MPRECGHGHSRVWHDGHFDCLVDGELRHVDADGECSSHGHVWLPDALMDMYSLIDWGDATHLDQDCDGKVAATRTATPCNDAACPHKVRKSIITNMICPTIPTGASDSPSTPPMETAPDIVTHAHIPSSSAAPAVTMALHDGHVDYLVGNHLHHPTEGCHGVLEQFLEASTSPKPSAL